MPCCAKGPASIAWRKRYFRGSSDRSDRGRHVADARSGLLLQHHRGEVRGHVMDRHPEGTAVGKVDQVGEEGGPSRGRHRHSCQGRGGERAAAMSADEWLHMVHALYAQHAPNRKALYGAMTALRDVPCVELRLQTRALEILSVTPSVTPMCTWQGCASASKAEPNPKTHTGLKTG
jgi:hypothetical protein